MLAHSHSEKVTFLESDTSRPRAEATRRGQKEMLTFAAEESTRHGKLQCQKKHPRRPPYVSKAGYISGTVKSARLKSVTSDSHRCAQLFLSSVQKASATVLSSQCTYVCTPAGQRTKPLTAATAASSFNRGKTRKAARTNEWTELPQMARVGNERNVPLRKFCASYATQCKKRKASLSTPCLLNRTEQMLFLPSPKSTGAQSNCTE